MKPKDYISIGDSIKRLRKEKKWTQVMLSDKTGIARQTISKWENDKTVPDTASLEIICSALDCDLDHIIGRIEERTHDTKTVCEITGLTEEVVNGLIYWKETEPEWINNINEIISDPGFLIVMEWLSYLFKPTISNVPEEFYKSENVQFEIAAVLHQLGRSFENLCENIFKKAKERATH